LKAAEKKLRQEIASLEQRSPADSRTEDEIAAALNLADQLPTLAADEHNLVAVGELFQALNVQLFLRFQPVRKTKRVENKLVGGVLTMGDAPPPIQKYDGPTSRRLTKN